MKPKVSVIVPVYNTDRYLKSCLDSLVNQTLDDLEIIVVDDCSTDQSVLILEEYQKKYPMKMRIFRNPENKGQGYARNVGIRQAKGEYIGFVDSDDYVNPRMYYDMYKKAVKYNYPEIISTNIIFVKDDKYLEEDLSYLSRTDGQIYNIIDNKSIILSESPSSCNKLFRKDFIKNQKFLENSMWEDFAFTYISLCNSNHVLRFKNADYFYRKRLDSGVSSKGFKLNDHLLDCFVVADEIEIQTKKTGRYEYFKDEIKFLQVAVCLERAVEVLDWNIDAIQKEKICFYIMNLINMKYENIENINREELSSKIGIFELEQLINIFEKYKNIEFSITTSDVKRIIKK